MSAMTDLRCPKCQAPMRAIERSNIVIDRCTECGGVFLDRGEIEGLMRAEGEYFERGSSGYRSDDDDDDDDERRPHTNHEGRPVKKKKRGGFLENLLDFG